jgi:hypothetical protein
MLYPNLQNRSNNETTTTLKDDAKPTKNFLIQKTKQPQRDFI